MVWLAAMVAYLVVTRWPLAPKYLYYFDSANFALALERFNPALHQPQPPGYPLFVAFTRLIHVIVARPEQVFLVAGLIAAGAAILLIRALACRMFTREAGTLAAALLASNPVFWFGGLTNQIRLFLAVEALGVLLLAWRARERPADPRWLYATFGAIGLAAGFRPVIATLLAPVAFWVWWRNGRGARRLSIALATLGACALPWLSVTLFVVGGPLQYLRIMDGYATEQFQGTSALFGARAPSALQMLAQAVVWNLLGAIVWIWAVPMARVAVNRDKAVLLALAGLPPFLFSAFVHIGDPDQALGSISILCVAGAAVLAQVQSKRGWPLRWVAAAVVLVQTALFFFPPTKLAKAASYRHVAMVDRMTTAALTSIESLRREGPLTIVHYGSSVASRQLAYYFPDDYVAVLPPSPEAAVELYQDHQAIPAPAGGAAWLRPNSRRVVCLLPWNSTGAELPGWKRRGTVYYQDLAPGQEIDIGNRQFIRQMP